MDSSAQWKKRKLHQNTQRSEPKIMKAAQLVGQLDHWQPVHQMMSKCSSRRTNVEPPAPAVQSGLCTTGRSASQFHSTLPSALWLSNCWPGFARTELQWRRLLRLRCLFHSGQSILLLKYTDGRFGPGNHWVFCSNCQPTSDMAAIRHQWHQLSKQNSTQRGGFLKSLPNKNTWFRWKGDSKGIGKIPKLSGPGNGYLILLVIF